MSDMKLRWSKTWHAKYSSSQDLKKIKICLMRTPCLGKWSKRPLGLSACCRDTRWTQRDCIHGKNIPKKPSLHARLRKTFLRAFFLKIWQWCMGTHMWTEVSCWTRCCLPDTHKSFSQLSVLATQINEINFPPSWLSPKHSARNKPKLFVCKKQIHRCGAVNLRNVNSLCSNLAKWCKRPKRPSSALMGSQVCS